MGFIIFSTKIKNYKKDFLFILSLKENETLNELNKNIKLIINIIRYLTVKYKKLDVEKEYFQRKKILNDFEIKERK